MVDYNQKLDNDQNAFEKLVRGIPGYRGYKDRELSREADRILRGEISNKLTQQKERVLEAQRALSHGGGLLLLGDLDLAARRLETLSDTVRTATYGYAGLFDAVKIGEEELSALYEHDSGLLDQLPSLEAAVTAVQDAIGDDAAVRKTSGELLDAIADLRRSWDSRRDAIMALR